MPALSWIIVVFTHVFPDNWEPRLARLDLSGHINAWMGRNKMSWIQVRHTYSLFLQCVFPTMPNERPELHQYLSVAILSDQ